MGKKGGVDRTWLAQHINDPWVKLAQKHGYRSRAAFKLSEILDEDRLLRRGMLVVDLGAAPGAWCQVLRERLVRSAVEGGGIDGRILAIDLLHMEPIDSVEFFQGDFRDDEVALALGDALRGRKADLVVSDMAPNLSGVAAADSARMADLVELALDFARMHLRPEGALLAKCFHGSGYSQLVERFRRVFVSVVARKPKASRGRSAETYLLGKGLRPALSESDAPGER